MAKFVLAGKADCPYYAKAELLADVLRQKLPDFHIHKICVHPTDWKVWLEDTCALHGWKHSSSPIVWRELVDRGGKGMLLGGFSDFLEHARGYYGITSDMTTDLMLKIAAENLQTKELCMREEFQRCNSLTPLHVWISSALNPVCYNLIPQLFTPGPFPNSPAINLHLLDTDGSVEQLRELKIETEDLALPHLHEVTIHSDQTQAFHQAHFIIVLDDPLSKRDRNDEQDDKEHAVSRVAERFRCYGQLIEANAQKDVRVLVAGDVFINLKCSLLIENVPSVDPCNFVSMATQLECEAKAQLAQKLAVKTTGQFGIPEGLVFSMPVSFRAGQWSPRLDVSVTDELKTKLEACTDELKTVSMRIKYLTWHTVLCLPLSLHFFVMHLEDTFSKAKYSSYTNMLLKEQCGDFSGI
ncbi:putative malate dehydrogenase 1B isoform X3 [Triplophysa rosa]|uniref:putative malate dehydrogenase 1B isoform X3 n=1 Tax=Triplophysa rosa TaxID=992332 RepID=UPI00254614CB|nr:putative malate dehydrogenase 1B isoform X3 [Triplophysa rosa]